MKKIRAVICSVLMVLTSTLFIAISSTQFTFAQEAAYTFADGTTGLFENTLLPAIIRRVSTTHGKCNHEQHDTATGNCLTCGKYVGHTYEDGICTCGKTVEFVRDGLDASFFTPTANSERGSITRYQYTNDLIGQDRKRTNGMCVYTPPGYDPDNRYDVLVLFAGNNSTEERYLSDSLNVKKVGIVSGVDFWDTLFTSGEVKPMIIVTVNVSLYSSESNYDQVADDLRNVVLPTVARDYSTYAKYTTAKGISAARDHFVVAGFSDGSLFAEKTGLFNCYDLFGSYIFVSGISNYKLIAANVDRAFEEGCPIKMMYVGIGMYESFNVQYNSTYNNILKNTDNLVDRANTFCVSIKGEHEHSVFFASMYNALRLR